METISLIVSIMGIVFTFLLFYSNILINDFKSETSKKIKCTAELEGLYPKKFRAFYQQRLGVGLDKLNDILGHPFSAKALTINTGLAIFYATFLFMLSWTLGGSGNIGTTEFFPETASMITRLSIFFLSISGFLIFIFHQKIDVFFVKLLTKIFSEPRSLWIYFLFAGLIIIIVSIYSKDYYLLLLVFMGLYSPALTASYAVVVVFAFTVAVVLAFVFARAVPILFAAMSITIHKRSYVRFCSHIPNRIPIPIPILNRISTRIYIKLCNFFVSQITGKGFEKVLYNFFNYAWRAFYKISQ